MSLKFKIFLFYLFIFISDSQLETLAILKDFEKQDWKTTKIILSIDVFLKVSGLRCFVY